MPFTTPANPLPRPFHALPWVAGAAVLVAVAACGGRGAKRAEPSVAGGFTSGGASTSSGNAAGAHAGAGGQGGTPSTGGSASAAGEGGGAGAGAGHQGGTTAQLHFCFDWFEDIEPDPNAGTGGSSAEPPCPQFSGVRFTSQFREEFGNCFWEPAQQAPVADPPANTPPGDCCYAIAHYNCR